MNKTFVLLSVVAALLCIPIVASAQMSDAQVIEYVKNAASSGKSEQQIAAELLASGVTQSQMQRIKEEYEATASKTSMALDGSLSSRAESGRDMSDPLAADAVMVSDSIPGNGPDAPQIFGHDVFRGTNLTFEPNENIATPENYRLGPGDEVLIEIWGDNEAMISETISPEGRISVSQIGPVQLSGLTIEEASDKIRRLFSSKYSGLGGDNSQISVSLGQIRTIQVNIMGEVYMPGTYRLSSFSTVFNALYRANGVRPGGSLRGIEIYREGKKVAVADIYEYMLEGKISEDIRLQEGDIIIVPSYRNLVELRGSVKRPMLYEMKDGETLQTLIDYAGGFASNAYKNEINVLRNSGDEREIFTVGKDRFGSYKLDDGDVVMVGRALDRFSNRVEVRGYVFRPGLYELGEKVASVKQLVEIAGGLTEDAFLDRAILLREQDDLSVYNVSLNIGGIVRGEAADVPLKKNDILVVSGKYELDERGTLSINGLVANPGSFVFTDNTTIEDLILRAGGLLPGASVARVDVARRVVDRDSLEPSDTIGVTYTFSLQEGFAVDGADKFILEPYDVVSVRQSPGYRAQSFVTLGGAVAFPGNYQLVNREERISQIIERAGGLTNQAYPKGAKIIRTESSDDSSDEALQRLVASGTDSLNVDMSNTYDIALNLEEALRNPGSNSDVVLKSGDRIVVPEYTGTVRIIGEVMFPSAVVYEEGKSLKQYIDAAGGYGLRAKKSRAFIVYMNGSAAKCGSSATKKIEPGCTIIVPSKPERDRMSVAEVSSLASASSSFASMLAVIANLIL